MKCRIECFIVPENPFQLGGSVGTSQCACNVHFWKFEKGQQVYPNMECPIGRIESAADEAIARIRSVTHTKDQTVPPRSGWYPLS